jgi:hypothetical protein
MNSILTIQIHGVAIGLILRVLAHQNYMTGFN